LYVKSGLYAKSRRLRIKQAKSQAEPRPLFLQGKIRRGLVWSDYVAAVQPSPLSADSQDAALELGGA
jgi:hypothetical protein